MSVETWHEHGMKSFTFYIALFQAAIIINSVTIQDDLSQGMISRAILEKAGPALQEQFVSELQKLPSERSNFIYTKGFNLDCEHVLHVVWPSYIEGNRQEVMLALQCFIHMHLGANQLI